MQHPTIEHFLVLIRPILKKQNDLFYQVFIDCTNFTIEVKEIITEAIYYSSITNGDKYYSTQQCVVATTKLLKKHGFHILETAHKLIDEENPYLTIE